MTIKFVHSFLLVALELDSMPLGYAFAPASSTQYWTPSALLSDWNDDSLDSNSWKTSSDCFEKTGNWEDAIEQRNDGSFWSVFESTEHVTIRPNQITYQGPEVDKSEVWLDTLASLQAEELEFNMKEAERADKARRMEEWGFDASIIKSALNVAVDASLEDADELEGMQTFRKESYLEEVDLSLVESHSNVPIDPDTGEPMRFQMVYVDEHTCIGCTNCAMIAQSTFFMEGEHGRARVFNQWGDDDETIQMAIETCPVDCIHYVPYDELVRLEVDRRGQNINFNGWLVSQAGYDGTSQNYRVGGSNRFTAPQQISGNMGSRCNNCPSRGCKTCPMYGVGKNPVFEAKERQRMEKAAKRRLQLERDRDNRSADL